MNNAWIYKTKDIDGIYQSMIMKYVAKGYKIITAHMGGSQGEKSKIDFTDGTSIYRIWYDDDSERLQDTFGYVKYLLLSVRKYNVDIKDLYNSDYTLWFDKGEVIEEKKFYLINEYRHNGVRNYTDKQAYVDNVIDAKILIKKSNSRYISNEMYIKINLSKDDKKRIIDIIQTHHKRGYSTLKLKDIDYLERIYDTHYKNGRNQYRVIFSKDYKERDMYLKSLH